MNRLIVNLLFLSSLLFIFACEYDPVIINDNTNLTNSNVEVVLNRAQTNALLASGINPLHGERLEQKTVTLFGKTYEGVAINDYFLTNDQLNKMADENQSNKRLFASTNRVLVPEVGKRTIRIGGVIDGVDALAPSLLVALNEAIGKYNALNMVKLDLEYNEITEAEAFASLDQGGPFDIIVFQDSDTSFVGNFDGVATYPIDGNPGDLFGLNPAIANYSPKNITLVMMHEIGHTIGMVHADFLTRRSCGNTDPLDAELGDLLGVPNVTSVCNIAGTDNTGDLVDAVMTACGFFRYATADFTEEDADSFRKLYAQVDLPCADDLDNGEDPNDGNPGQDFIFCVELPASSIDFIIQVLGIDFYQNLVAAGVVCP